AGDEEAGGSESDCSFRELAHDNPLMDVTWTFPVSPVRIPGAFARCLVFATVHQRVCLLAKNFFAGP
ncbi:hypothetical protein, partial [Frondihabitans sp. Leaf304]|uniref:hypothetical protein n=1 Tax=Frondihabitans sp. Leaf304 TaxID=1736329 RepID=UPI001F180F73